MVTDLGYDIFINNAYFKDISFENKEHVNIILKKLFNYIEEKYKIKFHGFYKVKIYPNKVGIFMEIIKLDDDVYQAHDIDFRVVIIYNKDMYFKYEDYFLFDNEHVFFYKEYYYLDIKYIDNFTKYADMGSVVFIDDIDYSKCIDIKK